MLDAELEPGFALKKGGGEIYRYTEKILRQCGMPPKWGDYMVLVIANATLYMTSS